MKDSLQEIVTEICQISTRDGLEALPRLLKNLCSCLESLSSRFIDLDPSAKIDESALENFGHLIQIFPDESHEPLIEIYEALSLYLLMHDRFGEAADWYLKNEFDAHLSLKITLVLEVLD